MCSHIKNDAEFEVSCEQSSEYQFKLSRCGIGRAIHAKKVVIKHLPTQVSAVVENDCFSALKFEQNMDFRASVTIDGEALEYTPCFVISSISGNPRGEDLLLQIDNYENDDILNEDLLDDDTASFALQLMAATGGSIEKVLADLIGVLPPAIALKLEGQ